MTKRFILLISVATVILLTACIALASGATSTPLPTFAPPTFTPFEAQALEYTSTPFSETPIIMCTPPPCGDNEAYHCPNVCPGGCGTTCATHTPAAITQATQLPDPAKFQWTLIASGLTKPVGLEHAGDDSGRLFIIEQPGMIRIFHDNTLLSVPFLDISERVNNKSSEQGLLGLAFHPDYTHNGYFFVNYTNNRGDTVIARYRVSADPNLADPTTEEIVLMIAQPYGNHNGGHLAFGPDGFLYIGTGDGGSAGDPEGNAQNLSSLLGKMLRLDINVSPYSIPSDNPYGDEIWAAGLRNPWRYSFDRLTGDLFIGDVGQNQWEEIHFLDSGTPGGTNFGWDIFEGSHAYEGTIPKGLLLTEPIAEYDHGQGCSVTGGVVYRGALSNWQGVYLYGDYCSGLVWGLLQDVTGNWQNALLFNSNATISSFGEDEGGEVYLVDHSGNIYRLEEQ
ncbi:MAG: PQQ-dependent sugar dehydrogenase [Anaerolineales bacterium]|nr:PQQ-dependent sugar dehydrogenase [Chloroflexota bacterium]MBL6981437.1 PQQ-dependent sugar dehydrogenase [Anaerolineales bacterium]